MNKHIIITGTGRAGTTFLVQLFDEIGFDVGIHSKKMCFHLNTKCGYECDIRNNNAPYICKDPKFCDYADKVFARSDIVIEYIIVPIRDLYEAAESRRYVSRMFGMKAPGGLWDTKKPENQENQRDVLLRKVYNLMLSASKVNVPIILINYPMLVQDSKYLYEKLRSILLYHDVLFDRFDMIFNKTVHPEWVHKFKNE